jgi:predicted metal-dependent phosphoesterase TrpH
VTRAGWVRVDCHLHTAESGDAVTTIDQLAEQVHRNRLDVICITDHNLTSAAVAAAERGIGARVIVGEEIRTQQGDLIGLFLTERIPYVLPLAEVTGRIRAQGGLIYLPHPYDRGRSSLGDTTELLCREGLADVVEVFNAKVEDQEVNEQAARVATRYGVAGGAGSDAHDPEGIGAAYLEMPDFDGPAAFLAALHQAVVTGEYRPHAVRYARRTPATEQGVRNA